MASAYFLVLIILCYMICFNDEVQANCGGLIELIDDRSRSIQSPGYPSNYPPNQLCNWEIKTTRDRSITVHNTSIHLEKDRYCFSDYVSFSSKTDGGQVKYLSKFCGPDSIPEMVLESNILLIEFKSDSSIEFRGFRIQFSSAPIKCGGLIKGSGGVIYSPLFPHYYPPNMNCTWTIQAPHKQNIRLTFRRFEIEESSGCGRDYVIVQSKMAYGEIREHGKFCGGEIPPSIISDSNIFLLQFVSNGEKEYSGFKTEVSYVGCGGLIQGTKGNISTPFYPNSYPPNKICEWTIQVPPQHKLKLRFLQFEIEEGGDDCSSDFVLVQSRTAEGEIHEYGKYCGSSAPPIIQSKDAILLTFVSDLRYQMKGFKAEYFIDMLSDYELSESSLELTTASPNDSTTVNKYENKETENVTAINETNVLSEGCGGLIQGGEGNIRTPFYPDSYPPNKICEWTFQVPPQHKLKLSFLKFETEEGGDDCSNDFVLVQSRTADGEIHEYGKYCGSSAPPIIHSKDTILLTFVSDLRFQMKGFKAEYFIDMLSDYELSASSLKLSTATPNLSIVNKYENEETENVTAMNETNVLSEALKVLKEKVASIEDSQKILFSNYENLIKFNNLMTSKNSFLKEGVNNSSSSLGRQLSNDCGKYIFFLRRMLESES